MLSTRIISSAGGAGVAFGIAAGQGVAAGIGGARISAVGSAAGVGSVAAVEYGDPYWASVVALLHFDGSDASTTFTDEKGHTFTAVGNAQIDTAQSKFGGAAGLFDGSGDRLTAPDSTDWDFGTGDFTVEFFIRFNALPSSTATSLVGNYVSSSSGWIVQFRNDSPGARLAFGSSGDVPISGFSWSPSTATWYHVAVAREGSTLRAFAGGSQVGSDETNSENIAGSNGVLMIGAINTMGVIQHFNGWMDELRITKGVARYTAAFTPPTAPFPNS